MSDNYQKGLIPREAKAENYIVGRIPASRLIFLVAGVVIASMFGDYVRPGIQFILFFSFFGLVWILTSKDPVNPTKIFAQGLSSYILGLIDPKHYISIIGAGMKERQRIIQEGKADEEK